MELLLEPQLRSWAWFYQAIRRRISRRGWPSAFCMISTSHISIHVWPLRAVFMRISSVVRNSTPRRLKERCGISTPTSLKNSVHISFPVNLFIIHVLRDMRILEPTESILQPSHPSYGCTQAWFVFGVLNPQGILPGFWSSKPRILGCSKRWSGCPTKITGSMTIGTHDRW